MHQSDTAIPEQHPVRFSVDYPDRDLNRLTTAFRIFCVLPIMFVLRRCRLADGFHDAAPAFVGGAGRAPVPARRS